MVGGITEGGGGAWRALLAEKASIRAGPSVADRVPIEKGRDNIFTLEISFFNCRPVQGVGICLFVPLVPCGYLGPFCDSDKP